MFSSGGPGVPEPVADLLISGGVLVTSLAEAGVFRDGAVAVSGGRVVAAGPREEVEAGFRTARRLDAHGGLILPGLVNLHHHFYSQLARGLDPGGPPRSFPEVLSRLWWRLDRALDRESVRLSALLALADCVRSGVTTVFDHHCSPSCTAGILDVLAESVAAAGLSAVLCVEVSDRNGPAEAETAIGENVRFAGDRRQDPRVRGTLGLHASLTLSEETLARAARRFDGLVGVHIHVAEHPSDVTAAIARSGVGPVERLDRHGLLGPRSVLAHGVHLKEEALDLVARRNSLLVHNPESNENNGVGRLDAGRCLRRGVRLGLGTDGMSASVLGSLRAAVLGQKDLARDPAAGRDAAGRLLGENAAAAAAFLGEPLLGRLAPGAPADLCVVDAPPATPLFPRNLPGHLVYGASEAPVRHTVARGRILMEDFVVITLDTEALAREARRISPALWARFAALPAGTTAAGPGSGDERELHA